MTAPGRINDDSSLRARLRKIALAVAPHLPVRLRRFLRRVNATLFQRRAVHAELEADFQRILGAQGRSDLRTRRGTANGPRILLATNIGSYQHGVALDTVLGVALTLRGARVDLMQCDAQLPACVAMDIGTTEPCGLAAGKRPYFCSTCTEQGASLLHQVGLPRLAISEFLENKDRKQFRERAGSLARAQLVSMNDDGLALGEHSLAGTLRFYARGDLWGEPTADGVLRRYVEAALMTAAAMERAIKREKYEIVVAHHGIYVPQGLVAEVCLKHNVRLVTWNLTYRRHCFIFSHGGTYHHTMVTEPTSTWEAIDWSPVRERELMTYLDSREHGAHDWIRFHDNASHEKQKIYARTGISPALPLITLLSNVIWDAQLHYRSNAFPSMLEWVFETIRYFSRRPELQLAIRVHPAEITGFLPSRQLLANEISREFPKLPPNVFVVPPRSNISTYALCEQSDAVLIYNTKAGIEVAARGIPTVVAGEAWIRNKGFCHSPTTAAEYFSVLERLPFGTRMSAAELKRARMYAYHVFLRRMIPLPFLSSPERLRLRIELDNMDRLLPGQALGLDVICDGILNGNEFIYPAERLTVG